MSEDKNLPNSLKDSTHSTVGQQVSLTSYAKTNKLITALYMVTDIMDKEEPLRNKLRTLGVEILSDPERKPSASYGAGMSITRIEHVISFLDIASAMNMISEMNSSILKKEFSELKQSFQTKQGLSLMDLLKDSPLEIPEVNQTNQKVNQTRLGVQKGSTLMKALKDFKGPNASFDTSKKQRREEIISIIKDKEKASPEESGVTIKDIKDNAKGTLASVGEKTLQRELISMVHEGVLEKAGDKRWSRYFLPL